MCFPAGVARITRRTLIHETERVGGREESRNCVIGGGRQRAVRSGEKLPDKASVGVAVMTVIDFQQTVRLKPPFKFALDMRVGRRGEFCEIVIWCGIADITVGTTRIIEKGITSEHRRQLPVVDFHRLGIVGIYQRFPSLLKTRYVLIVGMEHEGHVPP